MIRNLDQSTFHSYGRLHTLHSAGSGHRDKSAAVTLKLSRTEEVIFRAKTGTLIRPETENILLTVSLDGRTYQRFCLDRTVTVSPGVFFALRSLYGEGTAAMEASELPEKIGSRTADSLRQEPRSRLEGIYAFYRREREPGFLFPGETHAMAELTYVDRGILHSVAEGQELVLEPGDLVIYGPNQWHMQYADIGTVPGFVTITFDLKDMDLTPLLNRKFPASRNVSRLLGQMLQEQETMDRYSGDMIASQLHLVLLNLLREAEQTGGEAQRGIPGNEYEIIRRTQQYVAAHIREKLSVPVVARQVDVSPSYLTALFQKHMQISPGEYIRRSKLQESKKLIRENNLNFTEIAETLHYSTVHHFSRQFKEKFGITPTEYAKSVR